MRPLGDRSTVDCAATTVTAGPICPGELVDVETVSLRMRRSSDAIAVAFGNPLPPCPDTPNCVRVSRRYPTSPDALYRAVQQALESLRPVRLRLSPDARRARAVYRVALLFKDDVDVAVEPNESGSVLHARSASRLGAWDLGVNRRRIHRFFDAVERRL